MLVEPAEGISRDRAVSLAGFWSFGTAQVGGFGVLRLSNDGAIPLCDPFMFGIQRLFGNFGV